MISKFKFAICNFGRTAWRWPAFSISNYKSPLTNLLCFLRALCVLCGERVLAAGVSSRRLIALPDDAQPFEREQAIDGVNVRGAAPEQVA